MCTSAQIKSDNRSRLLHETADRLVYCHEALRMRTKMQKEVHLPGAGRCVHAWGSDSDSDMSDEEDYAM